MNKKKIAIIIAVVIVVVAIAVIACIAANGDLLGARYRF